LAAFITIVAVIIIAALLFSRSKPGGSGNWLQFYSRGKEAGFSMKELEQLKRLIANGDIGDPALIFSSQKHLETCIKTVVNAVRMSGESEYPGMQDFLSRLFDYCKEIGIKNSEKHSSITNSRQISEGQVLKVLVPEVGVFKSEVIKNFGNYLTISRPSNPKVTTSPQWGGLRISVYFWREDDAGYVFDTYVSDEVFSKGISSLKVEHNDSLFRTQKRKSMRVKLHKPAFVYLIDEAEPHEMERSPGLRCMMEDISDTGCAYRVMGQALVGQRFKVQFSLDRVPICIPGTVRSVDYHNESNISLIHMEADPLPIPVRNHILCEVFDMMPDDDDELPFRVLEDAESEETSSSSSPVRNNALQNNFQEVI
jgi:hypothetical protein